MNKVRGFTDAELLGKVEEIGGFIPNYGTYLIIGVQSLEDTFNRFDDKFYVYDGPHFKMVTSGTTNAGKNALLNFKEYGLEGAAVLKTNQWIAECYKPGLHKGRMKALRQNKPIEYYRDNDEDREADQTGKIHKNIIWANFHGVDYDPFSTKVSTYINGWSFACQVCNNMSDYRNIIKATWKRNKTVDYALLKEW